MNQVDSAPFCPRCGKKTSDTAAEAPYHLTPGTMLAERYLVGKFIGEGGFGITYIGLDTVLSKRVAKVSYLNRTWECWSGQCCLQALWDQLDKLKFTDMSTVCAENPFAVQNEPEHEELAEPEELFDLFKARHL